MLALLLAGGCATQEAPPPVEQHRVVAATPYDAGRNVARRLAELGLPPGDAHPGGTLTVGPFVAREEWAECRVVVVVDDTERDRRADWARPQARQGRLTIGLFPSGAGTAVDVSARFTATYLDRYRNTPFLYPCRSTGVLERELLDAAGGPGGAG